MDGIIQVEVRGTQTFAGETGLKDSSGKRAPSEPDHGQIVTAVKAEGRIRRVRGALHVLYEEAQEDGGPAVKVHVAVRESLVEVHRRGEAEVDFVFEAGRDFEALYKTPYLTIPMLIRTSDVQILETDKDMRITLVYELFTGKEKTADSTVEMRFCF